MSEGSEVESFAFDLQLGHSIKNSDTSVLRCRFQKLGSTVINDYLRTIALNVNVSHGDIFKPTR